jgi:hypothetical protein
MYQLASQGGTGINFHGGGYGWYAPIAGARDDGFLARPIYYGMLLFAETGAGQLIEATVEGLDQAPLLTAYALRNDRGDTKVVIFNKNPDRRVRLIASAGSVGQRARLLRLHAPRVEATTDVTFGGAPVGAAGEWSAVREETIPLKNGNLLLEMPAASAVLVSFEA